MEIQNLLECSISPFKEMVAYETLWLDRTASFKSLSERFASMPNSLPSNFINDIDFETCSDELRAFLKSNKTGIRPNLLINNTYDYPSKLRDAAEPVELLYFSGNLDYIDTRAVSIVGSRKASADGIRRTQKLAKLLVGHDFTIVSGLAEGVDTAAHTTAIQEGGRTIAVVGTPLTEFYPRTNRELQIKIAKEHLLISQVPFLRYGRQTFRGNKLFFPERNKTMSALTEATIIVEASNTSGTLIQAQAALQQNRKLFILNSCFENKDISWPQRFAERGAIRVVDFSDILENLNK